MCRHGLEQCIARGLDGKTLVSTRNGMTHAIRLVGVEEETMTNIGDDARMGAAVLDENTAQRQHQCGRRRTLLGSAAVVVRPAVDYANASDCTVVRDFGLQRHV